MTNKQIIEEFVEKTEQAEEEIYRTRVAEHAKMNLPFAEGFIQGQISMRKYYKGLFDQQKEETKKLIENKLSILMKNPSKEDDEAIRVLGEILKEI